MIPTNDSDGIATFLGGKVSQRTLPVFNRLPGPDAPRRKRLLLPQGELAQMHDGEEPINYLAAIELRVGTVRGNHLHKVKKEYFYLLNGEVQLVVEDSVSNIRETFLVEPGQLVMILPGVAHALRVVKPGQAVEFSPARFDANDTFPHPVT